jgi:hypothetical protein
MEGKWKDKEEEEIPERFATFTIYPYNRLISNSPKWTKLGMIFI